MKRFGLCILTAALLLSCLVSPVLAAEPDTPESRIIDACIYEDTAELGEFRLTEEDLEALFYRLHDSGQLPWYTDYGYHYSTHHTTKLIAEIGPDYLDKETYNRTLYEQRIAEVLAACVFEGMTDLQIALSLHDYLITNCVYDDTFEKNTGYDLLINGTTVCAGYTELYRDLLNRSGVPCVSVISEPMEHTWNLVQIGGKWYHADLTWDDPSPDSYGYVNHDYFLVSDETVRGGEEPHYDWVTDITCDSEDFADAFFRGVESAIIYEDSNTCYLLRTADWNNTIYRRDESTGTETKLYTDKATYINVGQGRYTYQHEGLSYWNGRLWFNSLERLHSIKTDGTDLQTVHRYDTAGNKRYLRGSFITGDTAYLSVSDHEGNTSPYVIVLEDSGYHRHSYVEATFHPSCLEDGYTESVCECGMYAVSSPTRATGHDYQVTESQKATLFADGLLTETCSGCGDSKTEVLPQLTFSAWFSQIPEEVIRLAVTAGIAIVVLILRAKKRRAA